MSYHGDIEEWKQSDPKMSEVELKNVDKCEDVAELYVKEARMFYTKYGVKSIQ